MRVPLFRYENKVTTVEEGEKDRSTVKKAPWTLSGFLFDTTSTNASIDPLRLARWNRLGLAIFLLTKSPDLSDNEIREVSKFLMKGLIAFLIGRTGHTTFARCNLWLRL